MKGNWRKEKKNPNVLTEAFKLLWPVLDNALMDVIAKQVEHRPSNPESIATWFLLVGNTAYEE